MSKKMWNRIFKTKSTNKTPGISKKSSIPVPPTINSVAENRLSYYEEFHNCCQQQPPIKAKASCKQAALDSPVKSPSKFSKVVNTFTLKRSSKENHSNQVNGTATIVDTKASSSIQNENNYSMGENVGVPNTDKIGTPTATISTESDNTIGAIEESVSLELIPCPTCSRTFVPKTLEKHIRICEKMTVKKRKIFDSSRQRREGTELASYPLPKNYGLPPAKAERGPSPKPLRAPSPILSPKRPLEEVVRPPVAAKTIKKLTSPSPTSTSLLGASTGHSNSAPKERLRTTTIAKRIQPPPAEQCPYCERCFGIKAYDRHVEWCKEKALIANIKQTSSNSQVVAKERLEARTKYRAPCLKTKRSVNRDKYSCLNDENANMQTSMEEHRPQPSIMTSSMTSSFISDGSKPSKRLLPLKKIPTPMEQKKHLTPPESTNTVTSMENKKKRSVYEADDVIRNSARCTGRIEALTSVSSNTVGSACNATSMSDGDLEQLFEKELRSKNTSNGAEMHADTQVTKLDPNISATTTKKKKLETPCTITPKASLNFENAYNNQRRLIKERIEFFNSSSSISSSASCQRRPAAAVKATKQVPGCLSKNKSFIVGGLSDNYDPFLSAKRQLEELCSPSPPNDYTSSPPNFTASPKVPAKHSTPILSNKMTTSLTSTTSLTNPRRALTTVKSNFHRTSSLRAPRRSPLPMPTRPIFFPTSQKQRPTIQRGLSDEGPISSNFLKPEEFDEMPVRSVCVNDFAISNTPRVVRRDSNAAANRKNLRLHLPNAEHSSKDNSPTPPVGVDGNSNLLKTDSLAVFLKYENEAKSVDNPVINTKELKDKSNTLSKQNSAKSVILTDEQPAVNRTKEIPHTVDNSNIGNVKLNNIKLEPIVRPMTTKLNETPQLVKKVPTTVVSPQATKPMNLNLIFDTRDRPGGSESDYIDPKLINVCDNLSIEFGKDLPLSSNSSSSSSSSSSSTGGHVDHETEKVDTAENIANLSSSSNSSPSPLTFKKAPSPVLQTKASPATNSCSNSNRSSGGDNRSLLKRKMRLGRNQFLYDASPENETLVNDADDEGNNSRSPFESNRRKLLQQQQTQLFSQSTSNTLATSPNVPPFSPSTFDEFDFEEFLSSFDNDNEQYPSLFKDCREFLMNRSSLNKRSNIDKMSTFRSANEMLSNSARKYEQDVERNLNCGENKKRGEIFISIETDQTENDPLPKNDPLVAANPTAQIEEVDVNDNKFRKIEDDDVDVDDDSRLGDEESDDRLRMRRINLLNDFPNVRLNNAKNLIQQMHEDFQDLHAAAAAAAAAAQDEINGNNIRQTTGSSLYPVDSDEISSIECYPVRRGGSGNVVGGGDVVQPKHSADSAYGSLSRQSPTAEISSQHRSSISNHSKTPATPEIQQQSPFQYTSTPSYKYSNMNKNDHQKYRCRNLSIGSSSSGSDNSLPPISGVRNLSSIHQEHQSQMKEFKRPFHRNTLSSSSSDNKITHGSSQQSKGIASNDSSTNNLNPPGTPTSPSMKMSKFCHECGSKFLLDQAKFCMDCGVRRIILK